MTDSDFPQNADFQQSSVLPQDAGDMELLRRFALTGSGESFTVLTKRHTGLVFDVALRITGSGPLAEEIVQTVFIQLARKAGRIARSRVVTAWLHRAAVLESRAVLRAESRRQKHTNAAAMAAELSDTPPPPPDPRMTELLRSLDEALAALPSTEREVLLGHYYERQSYQEAGQRLGTSEAGARQLAARARKRLAAWFRRRHGAEVSVSSLGGLLAGHYPSASLTSPSAAAARAMLAESAARSALSASVSTAASTVASGILSALFQCLSAMKLPAALCLLAGFLIAFLPGIGIGGGTAAAPSDSFRTSPRLPVSPSSKPPPGSGAARLTDGFDVGQFEKEMAAVVGLSKQRYLGFNTRSANSFGITRSFDLSYGRQMQLARLVMRQPVAQMPALLAACVRSDPDAKGSMVLEAIFARWTEADPAAARTAMASLDRKVQDYALHAICGTLLSRDVAAAAREALAYPTKYKSGIIDGSREEYIADIIGQCARRDPQATLTASLEAPESMAGTVLEKGMLTWIERDAPAATAWLSGVCASRPVPGNGWVERRSLQRLMKTRPDLANQLLDSVPEGKVRNDLNTLLKNGELDEIPLN